MYTLKFALATAAAAVVLSAIGAASASAGWWVAGTQLSGSAALASTAKVTEALKLTTGETKETKLECTGTTLNVSKGEIASPNKLAASGLTFTGCKTPVAGCTAPSSLGTVPVLASELAHEGNLTEDRLKIAPASGTILATFAFTGETCALSGTQSLKGTVAAKTLAEERQADPLALLSESGQLKLGSVEAKLTALAELELANKADYFWTDGELIIVTKEGVPVVFNGRLWIEFAANQRIEYEVGNLSAAAYTLETTSLQPNETNFKFVVSTGVECKNNQELKPGRANACFVAIKNVNAGNAKLKAEYNGKKVLESPLFR